MLEQKDKLSFLRNDRNKIRKWPIVKWAIAMVILIAGIVFVAINNSLCYNDYSTARYKDPSQKVVLLQKNSVCEQKFKAHAGKLEVIRIYFDNQGNENSSGIVRLEVKDKSGNVIATSKKAAKNIKTRKYIPFHFLTEPEMKGGEEYTLSVKCDNVYNEQGFGIYTSLKENPNLEGSAIVDGKKVEDGAHIRPAFEFKYYSSRSLFVMLFMMIFAMIIISVPFHCLDGIINKKYNKNVNIQKYISRVLFAVAPIAAYFMVEVLSGYSIREIMGFFFELKGILNLAIYYILLIIFYAITNRTQWAAIILWTVSVVLGLTNYFVFSFRGIPVLAADILSVGTALNVADSFEYTFDISALWSISMYAAATGTMLGMLPYKGFKKKGRIVTAVVAVVLAVAGAQFYVNTDTITKLGIEDSQWKPQLTYEVNGTMLSFATSWKYVKTEKPEGYSVKDVEKVAEKYKSDKTSKTNAKSKKMPNVIAIMNESLADFNFDGTLETSEDYLPFIRSMKKNTIKGKLYVSIEGANTANSEFEFLTGNSLAFFAPRAVPYNNYVKGEVPSLTRTLKAQGYVGNNSYHPYKRSGWNRENVYNSLGFNEFFSEEHYENPTYIRNFISDETDMEYIIKDYEENRKTSSDPFYLFNVTVQNHGGYVGNRGFVDSDVRSKSAGMDDDEVDQYLTLAKKSDDAFKKLIEYFEKVDEPTVIVMFGDHQPPLSEDFYSNLFGTKVSKFTPKQTSDWYSTPYVIWANYDIEAKENYNMSANYLSSNLLKLIGADLTGYNKYLLDLQKKVPVLTGMYYAGDDGVFHNPDDKSKYTKYIEEYSKVQYNGLLDKKHRIDKFFFLNK